MTYAEEWAEQLAIEAYAIQNAAADHMLIYCWRCGRLCDWVGEEFGCDDCDEPARCCYWGA
jgi:hypothetical protein